jgi:hypothetical protein
VREEHSWLKLLGSWEEVLAGQDDLEDRKVARIDHPSLDHREPVADIPFEAQFGDAPIAPAALLRRESRASYHSSPHTSPAVVADKTSAAAKPVAASQAPASGQTIHRIVHPVSQVDSADSDVSQ